MQLLETAESPANCIDKDEPWWSTWTKRACGKHISLISHFCPLIIRAFGPLWKGSGTMGVWCQCFEDGVDSIIVRSNVILRHWNGGCHMLKCDNDSLGQLLANKPGFPISMILPPVCFLYILFERYSHYSFGRYSIIERHYYGAHFQTIMVVYHRQILPEIASTNSASWSDA